MIDTVAPRHWRAHVVRGCVPRSIVPGSITGALEVGSLYSGTGGDLIGTAWVRMNVYVQDESKQA